MQRQKIFRLSLSAVAAVAMVLSALATPEAAEAFDCYCTIPYTLQINAEGSSCTAAQTNFTSQANSLSYWFCHSLSRPTTVCEGPNVLSQSPCYWDFGSQKWRIDGFVNGHCLYCPGPKF